MIQEASYADAIAIGKLLNLHKDEVWKIVQGKQYQAISDLCMIVHQAYSVPSISHPPRKMNFDNKHA